MRGLRHEPEGFADDMTELIELQRRRDALDAAIDDKFVEIAVVKRASTSSIAEHLGVKPPVVSQRRDAALRRQQMRKLAAESQAA